MINNHHLLERRRLLSSPRYATDSSNIIILPFYHEFGWRILKDIRWVQSQKKHKICCIYPGDEPLYPNCVGYFYDWKNPIPEGKRAGWESKKQSKHWRKYDKYLINRFAITHPTWTCVRPTYRNSWRTINQKFEIIAENYFNPVDILIAPRYRAEMAPGRNLNWEPLVNKIADTKTIAICGHPESSTELPFTAAWQHPLGPTSGTIDLLAHCGVYIGGDSGVSHLAAIMDIPSIIIKSGCMTGLMSCNKNLIKIVNNMEEVWTTLCELDDSFWLDKKK